MAYSMKEMEGIYKTDYEKVNGLTAPTYSENLADANYKDTASVLSSKVSSTWNSSSTLAFASDVKQLTNALNKVPVTLNALQEKCKVLFQYRDELFALNENIAMYNFYAAKYNKLETELAQQQQDETEPGGE